MAPSREIVEALYQLRTTLTTKEQRDRLRAVERVVHGDKEVADHKVWLRDNAESVVLPEHPAVALLRELQWATHKSGYPAGFCPCCDGYGPVGYTTTAGVREKPGEHKPGCRLPAILAASKPGERALSELLAEERAKGAAEERTKVMACKVALGTDTAAIVPPSGPFYAELPYLPGALACRVDEAVAAERAKGHEEGVRAGLQMRDEATAIIHDNLVETMRIEVEKERAEEREAVCVWMTAEWGTQENVDTNELVGEIVQNLRDGKHHARGGR
jgi:hypothetical protein